MHLTLVIYRALFLFLEKYCQKIADIRSMEEKLGEIGVNAGDVVVFSLDSLGEMFDEASGGIHRHKDHSERYKLFCQWIKKHGGVPCEFGSDGNYVVYKRFASADALACGDFEVCIVPDR